MTSLCRSAISGRSNSLAGTGELPQPGDLHLKVSHRSERVLKGLGTALEAVELSSSKRPEPGPQPPHRHPQIVDPPSLKLGR